MSEVFETVVAVRTDEFQLFAVADGAIRGPRMELPKDVRFISLMRARAGEINVHRYDSARPTASRIRIISLGI